MKKSEWVSWNKNIKRGEDMTEKTKIESEIKSGGASAAVIRYDREALLKSKAFKGRQDAVTVLMRAGEKLTVSEMRERMDKFLKGKVD